MTDLFEPLSFTRGPAMKNRFMLAPLTNTQSYDDGILSDDEYHWLTMRAKGGFGLTMTCASHIQAGGKGFPGQLGIFGDEHLEGLTRLSAGIHEHDSSSSVQLHHAGMRTPADEIEGQPVCPSDAPKYGARAQTTKEAKETIEAFIEGAVRAEKAGFQGAEIHGAHGYLVCQYMSPSLNQRDDEYGGSLENRSRMLFEIIDGIRDRCGPDFQLGVRLSAERFGIEILEMAEVAQRLMTEDKIDYLDMSLWDCFKEPEDEALKGKPLMAYFTELDRGNVRLGVAGKIMTPADAQKCLDMGADFVLLGRAAILNHDFPNQAKKDFDFDPAVIPVPAEHLREEGLSDKFLDYMRNWEGFVAP